jgi:hypothetical protein
MFTIEHSRMICREPSCRDLTTQIRQANCLRGYIEISPVDRPSETWWKQTPEFVHSCSSRDVGARLSDQSVNGLQKSLGLKWLLE